MTGLSIVVIIALFFVIVAEYKKRPGKSLYEASLSDTAIHGEYVGISPMLASRGASLAESMVHFAVDETGVFLDTTLPSDGAELTFRTHYPPAWIFTKNGLGIENALAVRQYKSAQHAKVVISFSSRSVAGTRSDATMILGEGMPAPLGVFVRKRPGETMHKELIAFHALFFTPKIKEVESSSLLPIDTVTAHVTMTTGTVMERLQLINDAGTNLWTGTDQEITDRLSLIALGLRDPSSEVQKKALDAFVRDARVTGGVALVTEYLALHRSRGSNLVTKAMEAATCLLSETSTFNKETAVLEAAFGTSEPRTIHRLTGGRLTPTQFDSLQWIAHRSPQRRWTREHQRALLMEINAVISHHETPLEARREGARALKEFPMVAIPM